MSAQDYSTFNTAPAVTRGFAPFRLVGDALFTALRECLQRRKLAKMLELDPQQLSDCGVHRDDLIAALNAPLHENACMRLTWLRAKQARIIQSTTKD